LKPSEPPAASPPTDTNRSELTKPKVDAQADQKAFENTVYPLVKKHCTPCHAGSVDPRFAHDDVAQAWQVASTYTSDWPDYQGAPLVDWQSPPASRLVSRLQRDEHQCWQSCEDSAAEMLAAIEQWRLNRQGTGAAQSCEDSKMQQGERKLRLLSNAEYLNTLRDIFGESAIASVTLPNDISKRNLFDHLGDERPVQLSQLKAYQQASHQIFRNLQEAKLLSCPTEASSDQAQACASKFIDQYAVKLWRRPVETDERSRLVAVFEQSFTAAPDDKVSHAFRDLISAVLLSPHFLYRPELGEPTGEGTYRLNSWEVASALSYFFWRSLPDDELFRLARENALQDRETIAQQVSRLMADAKSRRGLGDFVQLWTRSYRINQSIKEGAYADRLSPDLKAAFAREIVQFFRHVVLKDSAGTYQQLLTAPYTLGGDSLAKFYQGQMSGEQTILMPEAQRAGLLTQASLLGSYAFPTASSPIHRGVFVIENMLCRHFPEPPAVMIPEKRPGETNRDRFAAHSEIESCAVCHKQIDGVGFGLENYDAIGAFRTTENNKTINAKGEIRLDGVKQSFRGARELAGLLADSREAKQCFVRQAFRYQLGRLEHEAADTCQIQRLYQQFAADGFRLEELFTSLFTDPAFLNRRVSED
jgi:hypothetical protein